MATDPAPSRDDAAGASVTLRVGERTAAVAASAHANVGLHGIQCVCLQEITRHHMRIGYHPPCMRRITILLEPMV